MPIVGVDGAIAVGAVVMTIVTAIIVALIVALIVATSVLVAPAIPMATGFDVMAAPMVADPLTRYDCVPVVAGAQAIVIAHPDRCPKGRAPVRVRAIRN